MIVPESAIPFIRMQRTNFKEGDDLREYFKKAITDEFYDIKPLLPKRCSQILDIGCGLGGIDYFLYFHYKTAVFDLLDKVGVSNKLVYGYRKKAAHYSSFKETRKFLIENDVPMKNIRFRTPEQIRQIETGSTCLVVSLYSWGYHYPITDYLEEVYRVLKKGGRVVLDIRINTDQLKKLGNYGKFSLDYVSKSFNKRNRILLIKE